MNMRTRPSPSYLDEDSDWFKDGGCGYRPLYLCYLLDLLKWFAKCLPKIVFCDIVFNTFILVYKDIFFIIISRNLVGIRTDRPFSDCQAISQTQQLYRNAHGI